MNKKKVIYSTQEAIDKLNELDRENTELREQIEAMKCCANCKHFRTGCRLDDYGGFIYCQRNNLDKWELKEK